jgi:hypothetical protein
MWSLVGGPVPFLPLVLQLSELAKGALQYPKKK